MRFMTAMALALICTLAHSQPVQVDPPPQYEEPPAPPFKMTAKEVTEYSKTIRAAVTAQLKDPASAQFQNLFLSQGRGFVEGKLTYPIYLCGQINAKNSYGGYVGFRRFAALRAGAILEEENDSATFSDAIWDRQCSKKLRDVK